MSFDPSLNKNYAHLSFDPSHSKSHCTNLSRRSEHSSSNLALVRVVSICLGPSAVAVIKGKLKEAQNYKLQNLLEGSNVERWLRELT